MHFKPLSLLFFIVTFSISTGALSHTGVDAGSHHGSFIQGLLHPLSGSDHLAAMVAVGLWSAVALRSLWQAPLSFVFLLTIGALAGFSGFEPPAVEPIIGASMLILGLLVAARKGMPVTAVVALVGVFAFFHGVAHGTEPAAGERMATLMGMVITTASLHLAGVALGHFVMRQRRWLSRVVGVSVAVLGGYTLLQVV